MEEKTREKVFFLESMEELATGGLWDDVVHVLCQGGSMSFSFRETRYNISTADYVILPNVSFATGFTWSGDFKGIIMCFPESFVASMALRSNYGIIGHLSLLQNPVMRLSPEDFVRCGEDLARIRERLSAKSHLFRDEMISHLLAAHVLDLYDIHARGRALEEPSERLSILLSRFMGMLYRKEYVRHRDIPYYASRLCVTPHYLSEVCKKVSGQPASYWIDRFTIEEITRLLCRKELTLTEIADRMRFSSASYLSRFVRKQTGFYPTGYRNNLLGK